MKRIISGLFLAAFGLGIGLLIGEGLIRLTQPQQLVRPCIVNDPELAFRGVPDCSYKDDWTPQYYTYTVQLNNYGLRMEENIQPQDSNLVLCLGDSFTYGMGVEIEDAFWGLLDEANPNIQLVNGGYPGYATGHCTKMLQRLSQELSFSEVIYFMYFNDLFDNINQDINYRTHAYQVGPKGEITLEAVPVYSAKKRLWHRIGIADWLYKNAHLFLFIKNLLSKQQAAYNSQDPRKEIILDEAAIDLMQGVTIRHLEVMHEACQAKEIPLTIVWMPNWLQLDLENDLEWYNNFPYNTFTDTLERWAQNKKDLQLIDPTQNINQLLADKGAGFSDYYFEEGHFNQAGNRLFFEAVRDTLLSR